MEIDALNEALTLLLPLSSHVRVRVQSQDDLDAAAALYAQTRAVELQQTDWSDEQKQAFCRQQFDAQLAHYVAHYPRARFLMIDAAFSDSATLGGSVGAEASEHRTIGRLYYEQTASELRLMEITIDAAHRNRGIGGAISGALLAHAMREGIAMGLHVESFNPAKRLYDRQGFREVETRGIYQYMRVEPGSVS
jgi:ribosomal protein S18 acetylase RimI-like enzyme